MKTSVVVFPYLLALMVPSHAQPASKRSGAAAVKSGAPQYKEESPLPEGWPAPGPFDQVARKSYPAYRAAFTADDRSNGGFRTLFRHIERNRIPMTAPVEMKLDAQDAKAEKMERMAFLYQSTAVGKAGADGEEVEVRDVPAAKALSYAWQGPRSKASTARAALEAELAKLGLKAKSWRLLGYNSPFIPRSEQTHELQALLD
jgi:hypothetical protein